MTFPNVQFFTYKAIFNQPIIAKVLSTFALFKTPVWNTDIATALASAKSGNRKILMLFTAPTFCTPCKFLEKEVLSSALFSSWVSQTNVVLLKIELKSVGDKTDLLAKYQAWSIPLAIALDANGNEIGRMDAGYTSGTGPQKWLAGFEAVAKMNQLPLTPGAPSGPTPG